MARAGKIGDSNEYREVYSLLKQFSDLLDAKGIELKDLVSSSNIQQDKELTIPCSIFSDRKIGALEAIVLYLRDVKKISYRDISTSLNRAESSLRRTYAVAKKKHPAPLSLESPFSIPLHLFADRSTSVQRHLVRYLKDHYGLTFSHIARLLARDPRTVWTAYHAKRGDVS